MEQYKEDTNIEKFFPWKEEEYAKEDEDFIDMVG